MICGMHSRRTCNTAHLRNINTDEPKILVARLERGPARDEREGVLSMPRVPNEHALLKRLGRLVVWVERCADLRTEGAAVV